MKLDKILLELNYNSKTIDMITFYDNKAKNQRKITINDFIENIMNSIDQVEVNTILSPLCEVRKGVRLIQTKHLGKTGAMYILHRKKEFAPMPVHNRMYSNVGIPSILFAVKVINNRVSSIYAVCVKDDEISYDTLIYYYPYSNVSPSTANVCLGGNRFTPGVEDHDYKKLYDIPNVFLSMPNTGYDFSSKYNTLELSVEEIIRNYENIEFDNDLLVPNKSFKTYKDFINNVGGKQYGL